MKPETAKRLEAILNSRQQEKQATTTRAKEQQNAEAKNLADFSTAKENTIKPAFGEIIDLYKAKAYPF